MYDIQKVLDKQGRSQTWLAKEIGVQRQQIQRYCNNVQTPKPAVLKDIAKALSVTVKDLIKD